MRWMRHAKERSRVCRASIRAEVNRRLHDGETAKSILPWLNADTDVLRILDERWHEQPVTAQNLSEWRQGGYQDWLARNEKVDAIKVLSDYSLQLARAAGGSITEGAAAVAGGESWSSLSNRRKRSGTRLRARLMARDRCNSTD